jgi:hypothetical protein
MTFFYDLNKRLASLAEKQNLAEHSVPAAQTAKKSPLAQALNERDLGKHNNATTGFKALAKKAGGGNIEKGNRIAGAQLAKMRAKGQVEEGDMEEGNAFTAALAKTPKGGKFKVGGKEFTDTSNLEEGMCPTCDCAPCKCDSMEESALQAYLGKKKYGPEGMKALQKAGRDHAGKDKMNQIRNRYDKMDEADMEEGNAFSGNLAKAKAAHKSEFEVDGKAYPVKEADQVGLAEKKKAKPDFPDIDGDGNRKETMKKAASDKKRSTGTAFDREHMDKLRKEKEAETHSRYDVKDTGYSKRYTRKTADTDIDKDDEVKSDAPKKKGRPAGPAKGPERTTKGAWKHKGDRKVKEDGMPITDRGEYDDEAGMAKDSLHTIMRHARELENCLRQNENLPEWVQEKIGQIKGMMSSVTDYILSTHERDAEQHMEPVAEKAVSQAQRKFMGMAHAMQKGEKIKGASPELKKVAKTMKSSDTHDFAATKEKNLPKKVKAKKEEVEETTVAGSVATAPAAPKASKGMQFGKGVYESINREVEALMESMNVSVNMSTDENGEPHKSITVSAEGAEADMLAQLLKAAGIDHQGGESCSTCGATPCGCEQQVDENSPDWPTNTETLATDPNLRTYSGGLNGPKSTGQSTTPVVASQLRRQVSMEESVELERSLFKTWKNYKG